MTAFLDPSVVACKWSSEGASLDQFGNILTDVYWEGVVRELGTAILSLKHLRNVKSIPDEEDIMKRIPSGAAFFVSPWGPWELDEEEWDGTWECAATYMAERQRPELIYRRARMLLAGLGLLDISRVIDFRDPILKSLEGKAQVNIIRIPTSTGESKIMIHTLVCCECRRPIRSYFYNCSDGCIHHDPGSDTGCSIAKHQYNVCVACYPSTTHTKQHLKKVRPYEPITEEIITGMENKTKAKLAIDVKRLQEHEDKREDLRDGNRLLRNLLNTAPEIAKRKILPFGNVHASIMFGPLIFEIGAPHSQGGALVTLRQTPDLAYSDMWRFVGAEKTCPAVAISPERKIYTCVRTVIDRNIHTSMAQVLGGLFSGYMPKWIEAEDAVIKALMAESAQYEEKKTKSRSFNEIRLRCAASRVADVLKSSFAIEVSAYIRYFTSRLTEPTMNLKWDRLSNNCQSFCKKIIVDGGVFDTILPKTRPLDIADGSSPRYLASFASEKFGSQYDSPRYHITPSSAYLAEFHTGEDVIEYFDTWPYIPKERLCARLLCWPCQNDTDCSIAQHMWQFPHETMSLVQMHILRNRMSYSHNYQTMDPLENEPTLLTDEEWFRNRLSVLLGLDTFLGAAGALSASYQMLHEVLAEQDKKREWKPKPVKEVGMIIRQGTETDGVLNFTIENVQKSILPRWVKRFSKDGKMERHLAKNTKREERSGFRD